MQRHHFPLCSSRLRLAFLPCYSLPGEPAAPRGLLDRCFCGRCTGPALPAHSCRTTCAGGSSFSTASSFTSACTRPATRRRQFCCRLSFPERTAIPQRSSLSLCPLSLTRTSVRTCTHRMRCARSIPSFDARQIKLKKGVDQCEGGRRGGRAGLGSRTESREERGRTRAFTFYGLKGSRIASKESHVQAKQHKSPDERAEQSRAGARILGRREEPGTRTGS